MQEREIDKTWSRAVTVWWSMMWRIALWLLVVMAAVMQVAEMLFPFNLPLQETVHMWAVCIVIPILGIYATHAVLNKNFGGFRVALVPPRRKQPGEKEPRGLFTPVLRLKDKLFGSDAAAQHEKDDKTNTKTK